MIGRCVTLSPPGSQWEVARGILPSRERSLTIASCRSHAVCSSHSRCFCESQKVCCVLRLLLLALLLLAQCVCVFSTTRHASSQASFESQRLPESTTRIFGTVRQMGTSPVMPEAGEALLEDASKMPPSGPVRTLINMSHTPADSSLKLLHNESHSSITSAGSLLRARSRLLEQMTRPHLPQKSSDAALSEAYSASFSGSFSRDNYGTRPPQPLHKYVASLRYQSVSGRYLSNVEDQLWNGVENRSLKRLEDHSLSRVADSSLSRVADSSLSRVADSSLSRVADSSLSRVADSSLSRVADSSLSRVDQPPSGLENTYGRRNTNNGHIDVSESLAPGALNSHDTAGATVPGARGSQELPGSHNRPARSASVALGCNRDRLRANLTSSQTRDSANKIDPFSDRLAIASTPPEDLPQQTDTADAVRCLAASSLSNNTSQTPLQVPNFSGGAAMEANVSDDSSFRVLFSRVAEAAHLERSDAASTFQAVQMEISDAINDSSVADNDTSGDSDYSEWEGRSEELDAARRSQDEELDFEEEAEDSATLLRNRRKRKIEMAERSVVEGGLAALPCDLQVNDPKDSVQLILWIKEGVHTPLYSYDYRELLGGRPKETKPDANSTLARRTTFRTDTTPAALLVDRVEADDAGIYRCRVDFLHTPTRNKRVNLTVIVPPSRARVSWRLDNSGLMPVHSTVVGPFLEAATPSLICSNDDGWPPPAVVWYEGPDVVDDTYSLEGGKTAVENELSLGPLTRADLGRRLTCLAANTNKTQPATTTVTLAMTLSIVGVRVEEVSAVWAGERAEVLCRVWGSRPPPTVVWWLASVMLPPTHTKVLDEGNVTVSVLHFTPKPQDDGAMLICQATNEKLPDQAVQDSRLLSVNYAPLVEVTLGGSLDPLRIKEGDDVYFECGVKAKPAGVKVAWKHNGDELVAGAGVFVSNMSLVIQKVTRSFGGDYTCEATNVKGTSSSPPLHLDVKYAPVCARQERVQHSVAKHENAEISCRVRANPANVTFRWTFNNTAEAIDVPDGRFVVVGTESRVNYTPMNDLDYGTLLCWANNTIGVQEQPCIFHIVAAGKPDPPHNCRVFDVTISSLQVTCLPGDDGGLSQTFLFQVSQIGATSPLVEVSRASPSFSVANLSPATAYKIIVAAVNDKGASTDTELKAYTVRVPETQEETSAEPTRDRERESSVPMVVMVGGGVAAVPLVVAAAVLLWLRLCRRAPRGSGGGAGGSRRLSSHSKGGASTGLPSDASPPAEEHNPDLLCHAKGAPQEHRKKGAGIATISSKSTYLLHNGGPNFSLAATTTVGGSDYIQLVCTESTHSHASDHAHDHAHDHGHDHAHSHAHDHAHSHAHDHAHSHAHDHAPTPVAAAVSNVPYFPDSKQQQVVEVTVASGACHNEGYQEAEYPVPPGGGCYPTLERKRRAAGGPQRSYPLAQDYQQQEAFDPSVNNPFPHLYQAPGGTFCHTPHGSQYNLAQYQGVLAQGQHPILASPTQSLQGTLRRVSKKPSRQSSPVGVTTHHHHCELHQPRSPLGSEPHQGAATVKRERRRESGVSEGVDREAEQSEPPTPNTARKSKRESAV
ncbi:uncharacterized protein [Procambarus clarkii]|uniref:uncharacterized protein isoform X2 n=1 Tax=Procambarus clarkii TaxID=6728 RepID=UPI00374290C6